MKEYKLKMETFVKNYTKFKKDSKISSNKIYLLFCFLNDVNPKHLNIKSFMPMFLESFKEITGITLNRETIRLYKSKNPIRCILDLELTFTIDNNSKQTEQTERKETAKSKTELQLIDKAIPMHSKIDVTVTSPIDKTVISNIDKTNKIIADVTTKSSVKIQKFKNYKKVKDWLLIRCTYVPNEKTYVHVLTTDFASFIGIPNEEIYNRSFIQHLIKYATEQYPNSDIKKEDQFHKTNTSYITNLKLKS